MSPESTRIAEAGRIAKAGLLIRSEVWSPAFCARIRAAMDAGEPTEAEILDDASGDHREQDAGTDVDRSVRRALDITIPDALMDVVVDAFAALRPHLEAHFAAPLSRSDGVGLVRYLSGGRYRRHRDRDDDFPETSHRRVSAIVWLSSATPSEDGAPGDFDGGTLRVWDDAGKSHDLIPRTGMLVAFPAHWSHEVLPVTRGIRDAVVDWLG